MCFVNPSLFGSVFEDVSDNITYEELISSKCFYIISNTPKALLDTLGGFLTPRLSQKCFQPSSIILMVSLSKALERVSSDFPERFDTREAL